ncbi:HEAT repeat-containing protein 4 [Phlyctochytrium bullatum]|nr:HEAT repeat-containing protein 4 [Phlyctochytrium bullatum]
MVVHLGAGRYRHLLLHDAASSSSDSPTALNNHHGFELAPTPRPHRKPLLNDPIERLKEDRARRVRATLLSSQTTRIANPRLQSAELDLDSLARGVDFIARRRTHDDNPVATAIDTPCVPNTNVRAVRPRPAIPKQLELKLRDLEPFDVVTESPAGGAGAQRRAVPPFFVNLKFDEEVARCFESWPFAIEDKDDLFSEPGDLLPPLKKPVKPPPGNDAKIETMGSVQGLAEKRTWQKAVKLKAIEKNVPYMLEIWQKAEGIDLSSLIEQKESNPPKQSEPDPDPSQAQTTEAPSEEAPPEPLNDETLSTVDARSHSTLTETRPSTAGRPQTLQASRPVSAGKDLLLPPEGDTSPPRSSRVSRSAGRRSAVRMEGRQTSEFFDGTVHRSLSESTMRLLKKLAKDAASDTVSNIIRRTLTGPNLQEVTSIYLPQGAHSSEVKVGEKKRKFYRRKTIFRLQTKDLAALEQMQPELHDNDFVLDIPNIDEEDEDALSDFEPSAFRMPRETVVTMAESASTPGYPDGAQALITHLSKINVKPNVPPPPEVKQDFEFSIQRLCSLIKYKVKQDSSVVEPENPEDQPPQPEESKGITTPWDFLKTKTAEIRKLPEPDSEDHEILCKTLLLCLHEESSELRFEASKLLISINEFRNLGRWDGIAFKNTLGEMLREGTSDESFLAGKTLCDLGYVDTKAIRRVRKGLGDLDDAKRLSAKQTLELLAKQYCIAVLEGLIAEAESTSWRVRVDVVELLEKIMVRHRPAKEISIDDDATSPRSVLGEDPSEDGSKVMKMIESPKGSLEGIKSLAASTVRLSAHDISKEDPKRSTGRLSLTADMQEVNQSLKTTNLSNLRRISMILRSDTNLQRIEEHRLKSLLRQATEVLLGLMWNDWSPEVRSAAGIALMNLGEGKAMFDWIMSLLESEDPTKRIDALKCLSGIGFMNSTTLEKYLATFKDPYSTVRLEASIGTSKCREPRVREALHWCLDHDSDQSVKIEAMKSARELSLVQEDPYIRDSILILFEMDKSDEVRKEAERVLVLSGVLSEVEGKVRGVASSQAANSGQEIIRPSDVQLITPVTMKPPTVGHSTSTRQTPSQAPTTTARSETQPFRISTMTGTFPEPLYGHTQEEVEIYFRTSLVGEQEQKSVVNQVKEMAAAHRILQEVAQMEKDSPRLPDLGLDLNINEPLKFDFKKKRKKRINIGV